MLQPLLISVLLVAATVTIHAFGTTYWVRYLTYRFARSGGELKTHEVLLALIATAVVLLILLLVEVILWALTYLLAVPGNQLNTLEAATYFSLITFTTVGYGDVTLAAHDWRLLSGIEALNGILLSSWTAALFFLIFQRGWSLLAHGRGRHDTDRLPSQDPTSGS